MMHLAYDQTWRTYICENGSTAPHERLRAWIDEDGYKISKVTEV